MAEAVFLEKVITHEGVVEPDRLSGALRVTKGELATAAGLSRESVSKVTRLRALPTQKRLREVAEIINRVLPWCGSVPQAFAWYRSQPIPSFGDQTAEDLVRAGRAEHVLSYLSRIAAGGYA
jgi:transcriptional regulator with XRE-family HTH domain